MEKISIFNGKTRTNETLIALSIKVFMSVWVTMSQQAKYDTYTSQTLTLMAKKVKQLRLEACVIKQRYPLASKTASVRQFVDVV